MFGLGGGDAQGAADPTAADVQTPAMPEIEGPITGPGDMYLDPLEQGFPADLGIAAFGYEAEDFVVSGTAAGEP